MKQIDYLIVGQGTAGSVLAWTLRRQGCRVVMVDDQRPSSSRVAAGICNPVTGRKLAKTWLADELFPCLHHFYKALEKELQVSFFHPVPIYRPYQSVEEQNFFIAQTANPALEGYVQLSEEDAVYEDIVRNELGGLETLQAAWVDLPVMLTAMQNHFQQEGILLDNSFSWDEIELCENSVRWQEYEAKKVISCEGAYARFNPYFDWLPWAVVKGEILTLNIIGDLLPGVVNQSVWLQPHTDRLYRAGATYEWNDLSWEPTEKARTYLSEKLTKLLKQPFSIQNQVAGIRPATQGRRPFLGIHPRQETVGIFNGLGSKGTSLAPFLAQQFADFLINGKELPLEANIQRFHTLYYSSIN
ncbi:MAG: FAD-dependent oxidoreductase [Siphonobacter sp.]